MEERGLGYPVAMLAFCSFLSFELVVRYMTLADCYHLNCVPHGRSRVGGYSGIEHPQIINSSALYVNIYIEVGVISSNQIVYIGTLYVSSFSQLLLHNTRYLS
jgi:hypothetical protein